MAMNTAAWFRATKAVYLDNATSRRDFRVQLRGNKSIVLFGTYLVLLIGSAMMVYTNTVHSDLQEVVQAQESLKNFYSSITMLLAALVSLVAPALTATTVVVERQRRSLDLVFSAPVSPRYFLVGKMISSFRYTWMLLILALPVTAVCVVLGGASWSDVLSTYALLSFQGLIMTSVGLLISTIAQKPVSAVLWSYAASIVYLSLTAPLGLMYAGYSPYASRTGEQPFFSSLNPFLNQQTVGTFTTILGHEVPNWIFVGIFALLMSKLCLLGAGIMLSPRPEKEIISLRLHALAYVGLTVFYGVAVLAGSPLVGWGSTNFDAHMGGEILFWLMCPLFVFMPFIACFGVDGERRFWPNGFFSVRHSLDGRPSGGLAYLLLFIGLTSLAIFAGQAMGVAGGTLPMTHVVRGVVTSGPPGATGLSGTVGFSAIAFATWTFYAMAFWGAFWAIGRFTSSLFMGLRAARTLQFASFVLLVLLPPAFISVATGVAPGSEDGELWNAYPLSPLAMSDHGAALHLATLWGIGMAAFAIIVSVYAETRTRAKLKLLQGKYDLAAAA